MTGIQTALVVVIGVASCLLGAGLGFWAGTSWGISWTAASIGAAIKLNTSQSEDNKDDENS